MESIEEKVDRILSILDKHQIRQTRSQEMGSLIGALAKAQGAYKKPIPNETSNDGKFANLEAILLAVKEALSTNGLAFYQEIELLDQGSGAALLITTVGHESGQFISSSTRVVTGKTDRSTGNTLEIHKRIQARMLLGIAPTGNDPAAFDDNGQQQAEEHLIEKIKQPKNERVLDTTKVISKDSYNNMLIELDGFPDLANDIMTTYKITTLADLPNEVYHDALAKIRRIKRTLEDYDKQK